MADRYEPLPDQNELVRVHCAICKKLVFKMIPAPGMYVETVCKEGHLVTYRVPRQEKRDIVRN